MKKILLLLAVSIMFGCQNSTPNLLNLETSNFYNANKTTVSESLKGEIVALVFWATWCSPCVASFPEYVKLNEKFKEKGFKILAVTDDSSVRIDNFLKTMEVNFPIVQDTDKSIFKNFDIVQRPTVVLLNREGEVVFQGNKLSESIVNDALSNKIINEKLESGGVKVVTNGGFSPGQDPVYNGMKRMLNEEVNLTDADFHQVIFRKSLGSGYKESGVRTSDNFVGITMSHHSLSELFSTFMGLTSSNQIISLMNDSSKYDVIYSKKCDSKAKAYEELKVLVLDALDADVIPQLRNSKVKVLVSVAENKFVLNQSEIIPGTEKFHLPMPAMLKLLHRNSSEHYLLNEDLTTKFISLETVDMSKLMGMSESDIVLLLNERGIDLKEETREILFQCIQPKNPE